jgi:hypothetical protein
MNMPGFTGEASLYKTGRHYYKAGNLTQTDGVYAAAITIFDQLHVVDFSFARYFTELCCSSCKSDCVRQCRRGGGPPNPEYFECVKHCTPENCTRPCNAARFGGCGRLLA